MIIHLTAEGKISSIFGVDGLSSKLKFFLQWVKTMYCTLGKNSQNEQDSLWRWPTTFPRKYIAKEVSLFSVIRNSNLLGQPIPDVQSAPTGQGPYSS